MKIGYNLYLLYICSEKLLMVERVYFSEMLSFMKGDMKDLQMLEGA